MLGVMKDEIELLKLSLCGRDGNEGLSVSLLPQALADKSLRPHLSLAIAEAMEGNDDLGELLFCSTLRFIEKKDRPLADAIVKLIAHHNADTGGERTAQSPVIHIPVRPSGVKS